MTLPILIKVPVLLDRGFMITTLFNLNHLLKDSLSNTVTQWGVRASICEFGEDTIQSIADATLPPLDWQISIPSSNSAHVSSVCVLFLVSYY